MMDRRTQLNFVFLSTCIGCLSYVCVPTAGQEPEAIERAPAALNIVFGHDPGPGNYDGVVGDPNDTWNLVDVGQTTFDKLRCESGQKTPVKLQLSENDGEWGITDHTGIYHAYIYHNNQSVDLQATMTGLPRGQYRIYVYAHGDAPDQNAEIQLSVGDTSYGSRTTLNDGTWDFRSKKFKEGVQYVSFEVAVTDSEPIVITSKRAGSNYSMFNAIQVIRLMR